MAGTFFVYGKNQKTREMVRWKIWQKVFPTFFVWLLEGVPFIVVFGFSEKVFKYLSSLFCWDLSGLPLSLCPTFMYLVPQKVLFWLSSVCWVRKLNTLKWDILATDVAVYFDSKLRKLKLQTWNRSTGPAKVREKPPNNAENRENGVWRERKLLRMLHKWEGGPHLAISISQMKETPATKNWV